MKKQPTHISQLTDELKQLRKKLIEERVNAEKRVHGKGKK